MKSTIAGLVMIATAGGLGAMLPQAGAPYRIGQITVPQGGDTDRFDRVLTYAARAPMTKAEITQWAGRTAGVRGGPSVLLVFAPGLPVPDAARAGSLQDALRIAERGPLRWRIDIDASGVRQITEHRGGG